MGITVLALTALAVWMLCIAPVPTIGTAAAAVAVTQPATALPLVQAFTVVALVVGLTFIWRSLSASGWRLVLVTARSASQF